MTPDPRKVAERLLAAIKDEHPDSTLDEISIANPSIYEITVVELRALAEFVREKED